MEMIIQWAAVGIFGVLLVLALRRPPLKDWLLIYFLKGYISIAIGIYVVRKDLLVYPVRFIPDIFETSILFELLVFPALCVFYNQTSYRSGWGGMIGQAVLYSAGMTGIEVWLERNTQVIQYHHWDGWHTFVTLLATFLFVRLAMAAVRYYSGE